MFPKRIFKILAIVVLGILTPLLIWVSAKAQNPTETLEIAQATPQRNAYYGDLHVHTGWSFDSYAQSVRTSPDDAYKFAKGQVIPHASGYNIQLKQPLDFYAVTDHAEYLGVMPELGNPDSPIRETAIGQELSAKIESGNPDQASSAFLTLLTSINNSKPISDLTKPEIATSIFQKIVETADKYYQPGKFTTFPAYEWTSNPNDANLHRNVIFRSSENVPDLPYSAFDSDKPEDLWKHLDGLREQGMTVLAIPHNGNLSNGLMFPLLDSEGNPISKEYAEARMRNEPLVEITQIKGQSETHPLLSDNDEFANHEILDFLLAGEETGTERGKAKGSYVRDAYKTGLVFEESIGVNPYKFGVIGSSDTHNSGAPMEEDNYFGKIGTEDGTPERRLNNPTAREMILRFGSGGVAAVWAEQNTREAIYDALARKETFGTTGTRIKVRLFGGWDFNPQDINDMAKMGYSKGVPMGSDLSEKPNNANAPTFLVMALKDPNRANLDRIQIVKGWSKNGQSFEKIYDVALSDGRKVNPKTGKAPSVGNTVNLANATYTNTIGDTQLATYWTDPDFNEGDRAFYYARVLEIPTPRWSTFDALKIGVPLPTEVPPTIQERAYTSPIWYNPTEDLLNQGRQDALTIAKLQQQGGKALSTAEIKQLAVGKRVRITNTVTGEQLDAFYDTNGDRTLTELAGFGGLHSSAGNVVNPYEIKENQLFSSMPDGSEFSSRVYQLNDRYYAARSDEAGYVNYEVTILD